MKNRLTILPISVLLSVCFFFTTYGQEYDKTFSDSAKNNLDPRKYISIYEVDKNTGKSMIVWNGNQIDQNNKGVVPQKVRTIDLNSELKIIFDSQKLRILGLTGNISLQAMAGERRIEVNPYSLIGQSQVNYGIKSKPVSDVARSLVLFSKTSNLLHDFLKRIPENEFGSSTTSDYKSIILGLKQLENHLSTKNDTIKITLDELFGRNLILKKIDTLNKQTYLTNSEIIKHIRLGESISQQDLSIYLSNFRLMVYNLSLLNKSLIKHSSNLPSNPTDNIIFFLQSGGTIDKKILREIIKGLTEYSDKQETIELQTNLATLTRHLNQFILYYDYYTKDEDDTKTTVLRVLGVDNLTFTNLFIKLKEFQSFITANSLNITIKQLKNLAKEYSLTIENAFYIQGELKMYNNIPQENDKKNSYESNKLSVEDALFVIKVEKVINDFLASQFVTATIDLKKAGIKEGETISITMLWSKSFKTKSDNEFDPLTVASFQVKELGWRLNVASSIILVNRLGIESNSLPNNYSPSRFKGSPGVSLLATYTGLKERSGSFLERLSPSFGLNVSYLDFDTSKDVEIGAGLIAGFFRNRVFFTWGFNLNVPDKPGYIGVGFSFAEIIAEVVKPSRKSGD